MLDVAFATAFLVAGLAALHFFSQWRDARMSEDERNQDDEINQDLSKW